MVAALAVIVWLSGSGTSTRAAAQQRVQAPPQAHVGTDGRCSSLQERDLVLGRASGLLEQTRYHDAAEALEPAAGLKCDFRFNLLLAAAFEGMGDVPRAEQVLAQAHRVWPSNTSIAASLAREYMSAGHVDLAVQALGHFHASAATPPQEIAAAAVVLLAAHRLASAQALAEVNYQSHPSLESLLLLANTLQLEGRYKDVIALLGAKRAAFEQSPAFLVTLAESEYDANIFDAAGQDLKRAIELDSTLYQAHYLLGNVLLKQGDADRAEAEYGVSIRLAGNQPRTYYQLALALRAKQDEAGEERVLARALAIDDRYAEAYAEMGRILLNQGRLPEAVTQLNLAIENNRTLEQAYNLLARAYGRMGEMDKANAVVKELATVRSTNHRGSQLR